MKEKKVIKTKDKQCSECNKMYSVEFRNTMSKYCSNECRTKRNSRIYREKKKAFNNRPVPEICKDIEKKYRERAKKKGRKYTLTIQDFINNYNKPCFYCGHKYKRIGFDRLDSKKGYTQDNIKPCCTECNMMKRTTDLQEFIQRCKDIVSNFT